MEKIKLSDLIGAGTVSVTQEVASLTDTKILL